MRLTGTLFKSIFLIAIALTTFPVSAQEAGVLPPKASGGVGLLTCDVIIDWQERSINTQSVANWATGFWTGMNLFFSQTGEVQRNIFDISSNPDAITSMIVGRCYEDPNDTIMNAAMKVFATFPEIEN